MANILTQIEQFCGHKAIDVIAELECEEYCGLNFKFAERKIKFRKAKTTPKKVGQFVTLWTRNADGKTEPFNEKDGIDFCLIVTEEEHQFGFFLFPRSVLIENGIFTTSRRGGKRGFRVYPPWSVTNNKQAQKSQYWQTTYFIDLKKDVGNSLEKFKQLFCS